MRRVVVPAVALCGWLLLQGCGGDPPAPAAEAAAGPDTSAMSSNRPPVIDQVVLQPSRPRPGETVTVRVTAHDPDGDSMRFDYQWRANGRALSEAEGQTSIHVKDFERDSSIEVTVVAHDAHTESASETAVARVGNLPPTIVAVGMRPEGKVSAGIDITATPRATDPEGGEVEFEYEWQVNGETLPIEGATLTGDHFSRGDVIVLRVIASDGSAESEPVTSPEIPVGNAPPRVVSKPGQISADGIFRYALQTEDPDGDSAFRYRLIEGPRGMVIGFDDGAVKWEPPVDAAGTHEVEIEVQDLFGGRASYRFALELAYETEVAPPAAAAKKQPGPAKPAPDEDASDEAEEAEEELE